MDATGHPLSLKVMRVSRPALASSWQPFFTSSPSFSAHATESLLSLQGKDPLPGHPKTLRDLTHASQLLTLPLTFGAIQLGETFTSCLCVNNEAAFEIEAVTLRVEMQTASSKVLLAEVGGPDQRLKTTDVLEAIVSHEMKELGQHVLACSVTYRFPQSVRAPPAKDGDSGDPSLQTFRKYYKFAVTNPLNVKTKVHVPRSPTALSSRTGRETVFLEIHVQNLTQEPMWFERMQFECVDGWKAVDGNISHQDGESLFSSSIAIMQPQDIRQYVYILTPTSIPSFPVVHPPGTIIPLGRLDISWRSPFGEPGRLLTSLLTRRIPTIPTQTVPSAIPPHLQHARPRSPQHVLSRPSTPPGSPASLKPRPPSQQVARPQSPASNLPSSTTLLAPPDLEADLVVRTIPHSEIHLERPFKVNFGLTLSGLPPPPGKTRLVHLAIQHLQPTRAPTPLTRDSTPTLPANSSPRASLDVLSPKTHSNRLVRRDMETSDITSPTMSPRHGVFNFGLDSAHDLSYAESSPVNHNPTLTDPSHGIKSGTISPHPSSFRLPPPFSSAIQSQSVLFLGASLTFLSPVRLTRPPAGTEINLKSEAVQDFECTFVAIRKGLAVVGGLRLLLVEDRELEESVDEDDLMLMPHTNADARVLREWDVVREILVGD